MYKISIIILITFFSCSGKKNSNTQPVITDSTWERKKISNILSISLPDSSSFNKISSLNASFGKGKLGLYGVDYFDTIIVSIKNEADYQEALRGYLSGKLGTSPLKSYDLTVRDTIIGNSNGYFLSGFTIDSLQPYKYPFCYLTLANERFYWLYALQHSPKITDETRQFFNSIKFDKENIIESNYQTQTIRHHKSAE